MSDEVTVRTYLSMDNAAPAVCNCEPNSQVGRWATLWLSCVIVFFVRHLPLGGADRPTPPVPQAVIDKLKLQPEQIQRISKVRGSTPERLADMPEQKLARSVFRADYPDLPRDRAAFRVMQEKNEDGTVAPAGHLRAIQQLRELRGKAPKAKIAGIPVVGAVNMRLVPPTAGLANSGWTSLGPGNIGGRIRSLVIHPVNTATMWAASVAGGIWRTDDGGANWFPVDDFMINLAVTSLVISPTNSNEMYAGTGEGFSNIDALRGAGIFRTTDGGTSWSQLPATAVSAFHWTNRLSISPAGDCLLAATRGAVSGDGGLYRSIDDGTTWTRVHIGDFADVAFHPTDPNHAIAATLAAGEVYYTQDKGITWTLAVANAPGWSGRIELAYAKKDPSIVYASSAQNSGEIWRSTDGGKTFDLRNSGENYLGEQGWYDNVIWAGDPSNADLVIVGGVDLWRSTDGGATIRDISTWWADSQTSAHADHHAIVAHPDFGKMGNKTVFFCNDGGVYKTANVLTVGNNATQPRTNGWTELNNTIGITQFYGAAGNPSTGIIIAGAQDNGTLRYDPADGPEKYSEMFGGDGGFCAADPTDSSVFYGEYVYLNIHRSIDGGKSSDYISGQYWNSVAGEWQWKPFPYTIPDAKSSTALFIAPFVLDPNESNRILAGGRQLWRTNNAKANLTATTGPKWASMKPSTGSAISAIAVAPGHADKVWVGHANGDIFQSADATTNSPVWTRIGAPGPSPLPRRYCHRIVIDPTDPLRVFVCFGGYSKGNVWRTVDGGTTWKDLGGALPDAPVRTLAIHPSKKKLLYLGTEVGIFSSEDNGDNWSPTNEGPTNCSIDELFWMGKNLHAATHGRGIFMIDLSSQ